MPLFFLPVVAGDCDVIRFRLEPEFGVDFLVGVGLDFTFFFAALDNLSRLREAAEVFLFFAGVCTMVFSIVCL